MAYIKVDHSKLKSTANAVDTYVKLLRDKMGLAQSEIEALSAGWEGQDYTQFLAAFDAIDNGDSTHAALIKALESYAEYLRYAGDKYRNTQASAINAANLLPRW